ncbi:hypothetical protein GALL_475810 [mine drainage metagenome]|uniref:Uncharacterized protein n=1 Tax=mine drainage metagenome TaxID=410659 RepID=A0A1J5Q4L8_9ZZZZ
MDSDVHSQCLHMGDPGTRRNRVDFDNADPHEHTEAMPSRTRVLLLVVRP